MTVLEERAVDIIGHMPEEKLYYVVQLLESDEGLSEIISKGEKTPEQKALEDLQRFRKRSDIEIDYKAELAKAREEKYAVAVSADYIETRNTKDFASSRVRAILPDKFLKI